MVKSNIRMPAVAGQFYPATASQLSAEIKSFIDPKAKKKDCIGCLLPHAGYVYSGPVAGATVSHVIVKEKIILLGPNHTGLGTAFSLMREGSWKTPLGDVPIDSALATALLDASQYFRDDPLAHLREHSLEVELPFLQYFRHDFQIVPIAIAATDLDSLQAVGIAIGATVAAQGLQKEVLLVASSDMTHYEPKDEAKKKDSAALEAVLELDEEKLMKRVRRFNISMCGFAPTIVMLAAAKVLGAKKGELIKYQTSGDITKDYSEVVGYAGVIVY